MPGHRLSSGGAIVPVAGAMNNRRVSRGVAPVVSAANPADWEEVVIQGRSSEPQVWVLPVGDTMNFEVEVAHDAGCREYMFGVALDADEEWGQVIGEGNSGDGSKFFCVLGSLRFPQARWNETASTLPRLDMKGKVTLRMQSGRLTIKEADGECLEQGHLDADNGLKPCILTCWRSSRLRVKFRCLSDRRGLKRKYEKVDLGSSLFGDRQFTDAFIRQGEKIIPVHRAILANASPVFASMFKDVAAGSEVTVDGPGNAPIETLVECLYTQEVPTGCPDLAHLFALACSYSVPWLAWEAGQRMLDLLDRDSATTCVRTLKQQSATGNPDACELWSRMLAMLHDNKLLMETVVGELASAEPVQSGEIQDN